MEYGNETIKHLFTKAASGDPISQFLLIKEYLLDFNNPDSIERAYRLLQTVKSNYEEISCMLAKFHWGDFGRKYINFVKCQAFLNSPYTSEAAVAVENNIEVALSANDIEPKANRGDNWAMWIMACRMYHNKQYEESAFWARKIRDKELLHCAIYLRGYILEEKYQYIGPALNEYTRSAKYGSVAGAYRAAQYYFGEHPRDADIDYSDPDSAFYYSLQAAKNGYVQSMLDVGRCYRYSRGTSRDDYQAFKWLYKATYLGCDDDYEGSAQQELAQLYIDNKIFTANSYEAYSWLQSYNLRFSRMANEPKRKELADKICDSLTPLCGGKPNKYAEKYYNLMKTLGSLGPYTSDDLDPYLDYLVEQYKESVCIFDATTDVAAILDKLIEKVTVSDNASQDSEDPESSADFVYKYLKNVVKGFDRSKVRIKLNVHTALTKSDKADFTEMIITYNNQMQDPKKITDFTPKPIILTAKARRLMLKLAVLSNDKDEEQKRKRISEILKNPNLDATVVSCLNRLIYNMFPNCFKNERSNMIDKARGELYIQLVIEKYKFDQASDYKALDGIR
jgi:TPR repeat protein